MTVFLVIDVCASLTNLTTLVYIATTFNIKTHVFTLLFLDSLNSTVCCMISTLLDSLLLAGQIQQNFPVCYLAILTFYLPTCFGPILTVLITLTRYILAKLSAKNIQPSNKKVSVIALALFTAFAAISLIVISIHAVLDLPLATSVEICIRGLSARPINPLSALSLMIPIIYNVVSLVTDMKMIIFLRKVIIPAIANVLSGLGTHFCVFLFFCFLIFINL